MSEAVLQFAWFTIFVILLAGYSLLDGFDLGVGMLHLTTKSDTERRLMMNSIGPVWDGNEVWLVTAGGALFAGFPMIYATVCSAFYEFVMFLLGGLIFRAVAIEFRSKNPSFFWRLFWDVLFALASFMIAFGLGVVLGNLVRGISLDANGEFTGSCLDLFHPYAFLVGLLSVALFCMHGGIYLLMKTEEELHDKIRKKINPLIIFFILTYTVTTMATLIYQPHMIEVFQERPLIFLLALIHLLVIANIPREINLQRDGRAFIMSCMNIGCLFALYALGTYPNVVRAINDPTSLSLTLYNSSSSKATLEILLLIAVIGIPLVVSYTVTIYYIFRGKVKLDPHSY